MNFFTPAEVAKNYIATGKSKVNTPIPKMIILAIHITLFVSHAISSFHSLVQFRLCEVFLHVWACAEKKAVQHRLQ